MNTFPLSFLPPDLGLLNRKAHSKIRRHDYDIFSECGYNKREAIPVQVYLSTSLFLGRIRERWSGQEDRIHIPEHKILGRISSDPEALQKDVNNLPLYR